ncbi:MAG TPA: YggS family pyridoxal phosphate-dependent enzyme [Candidatus Nanopelagicales bacterium]|nr:YggS family pyridoxal phosphate-dependent enzyme [Candidatus Nanopelagicales bacterium]
MSADPMRREQLKENLAAVRARIDRAKLAAGRTDDVTLVVVTKTFPATDVQVLAELGVRDVGENRDQEAKAKRSEVDAPDVRWHMIGRLQSNKAASVAQWADVVESVDRESLVPRLAAGAQRRSELGGGPVDVLIQVSLDGPGEVDRGGAHPGDIPDIAQAVQQAGPAVRLGGVMAVAPHPDSGVDPVQAFETLAEIARVLRQDHPDARVISAGMSGDLEEAIRAGATQVRIGGAVLGQRPRVQ